MKHMNINELGKRVAIVGVAGAGKSTLTLLLQDKLKLPTYYTDQFSWADGWGKAKTNYEIIAYVDDVLQQPEWLIEGYLGYLEKDDFRLQRATSVIVLDYRRWRLAWHILKRNVIYHNSKRPEMPDICIDRFGWHTIQWIYSYFKKPDLRKNMNNWIKHVEPKYLLRFRNPRQLSIWLTHLNV